MADYVTPFIGLIGAAVGAGGAYWMQARQRRYEDSARLHKERLSLYTEFLRAGLSVYAGKAAWLRRVGKRSLASLAAEERLDKVIREYDRAFTASFSRVRLLSSRRVANAAHDLYTMAKRLDETALLATSVDKVLETAKTLRDAFEEAARNELGTDK
jgi:hypothetical protein